jgi:predicted phosphodiesterase
MASKTYEQNGSTFKFFTHKSLGRNIEYSKQNLQKILNLYCCDAYLTATEISLKLGIPKKHIEAIVRALALTHKSAPFLDEEVIDGEVDDLSNDMLALKKNDIINAFEKKKVQNDQEDALKWRKLEQGVFEPVEKYLKNWKPNPCKPLVKTDKKHKGGSALFVTLSDNHLGERSEKEYLFHGEDYSIDTAVKNVNSFRDQLLQDARKRIDEYDSVNIVITGDFFHTCIHGMTAQSTKLHSDYTDEKLFVAGLNLLVEFISQCNELFPKTKVTFIKGNHDHVILSYLGYAIQQYFRLDGNIEVEVVQTWAKILKIGKLAALVMHGGSGTVKNASIPRAPAQMANYIQELFLAKSKELGDVESRICVFGHFHQFQHKDFGSFESYCMGSSVTGDSYADAMSFQRSTPRQNALVIKNGRVKEVLHYYFN